MTSPLNSVVSSLSGQASYEETRSSTQHGVIGDVLLYFRNRRSWVRPYLSAGAGLVRLEQQRGTTHVCHRDAHTATQKLRFHKPRFESGGWRGPQAPPWLVLSLQLQRDSDLKSHQ